MHRKISYNIFELPMKIEHHSIQAFKQHKTSPHWHTDFEFLCITEGKMNAVINGFSAVVEKNDIIIIDSNCVHYFEEIEKERCVFYNCLLSEQLFINIPSLLEHHTKLIQDSNQTHFFVIKKDNPYHNSIQFVFQQLISYSKEDDQISSLLVLSRVYECVALLIKAMRDKDHLEYSSSNQFSDSFKKMVYYIQLNYSQKITIEDLCQEGNVSRRRCFELFRNFFGKTPSEYINEYRLNTAQMLLSDSIIPISQIAIECGFTHQSHFTHLYKKYFGFTPLQYRKKIGS